MNENENTAAEIFLSKLTPLSADAGSVAPNAAQLGLNDSLSGVTVGRDAQEATKRTLLMEGRGETRGRAEERRESRRRRGADSGGEAQARRGVSEANDDVSRRASPSEPREEGTRRPEGATRVREEPTRCPRVAMRGHGWGRSGAERSLNAARCAGLSPELNLKIGERRQGRAPRPLTDASTVTPTVSARWNSNRQQPNGRQTRKGETLFRAEKMGNLQSNETVKLRRGRSA